MTETSLADAVLHSGVYTTDRVKRAAFVAHLGEHGFTAADIGIVVSHCESVGRTNVAAAVVDVFRDPRRAREALVDIQEYAKRRSKVEGQPTIPPYSQTRRREILGDSRCIHDTTAKMYCSDCRRLWERYGESGIRVAGSSG